MHRVMALFTLVACLLIPAGLSAQTLGTITGVIKDASDAVLPGVTVEASSPVLIEKTRTVVSEGNGQFNIVNLPPGTYNVSFSLTGFSTVNREALVVSIGVTAVLNITMRVGSVAETVTVTGETPVVDLRSTSQTTTADARAFKEMPTGGSWINMAQLIPAVNSAFFGNRDVGGLQGDQTGTQVSVHGGLAGDGVSMIDGMRIGNMYLSSNLTNMSLSPLLYDEVNISFSGQVAESGTNGVLMNAIPKSGGNSFHGSFLINGSSPSLQASNEGTDRLKARGAPERDSLKTLYDINGAIGGPIKKDALWFYFTSRYFTNEYYMAGQYYPVNPAAFVRTPDLSRQAFAGTWTADNNIRLTWAPTGKQKVSGWYAYQRKDDPHWLQQILFESPEAAQIVKWPTQLSIVTWTYAATNRILLEAGVAAGASPDTINQPVENIAGVPVFEVGGADVPPSFANRASWFNDYDDHLPSQTFKGSLSYIRGSHNLKVGMQMQRGHFTRNDSNHKLGDYYILSINGMIAPPHVGLPTITSPLSGWTDRLNHNLGIYGQDSWTVKRLTLNAGIRLDMQNESVDAYHYGPGPWLPNRNIDYPEIKNVPNWKDVSPRINAAYDLFGNGKTAIKGSVSRSVQQDSIGIARANDPAANPNVTSVSRVWLDLNNDRIPNCDLSNPGFQAGIDLCDVWLNPNFGNPAVATTYDPRIMNGWGVRPYNWEFSVSAQHEIIPRLSVSAGYFRRVRGNFWVTDNEAVSASNYSFYSVTVPNDPGLPNAGQVISGLPDLNPDKVGQIHNVVKDASQFGNQIEHWDGYDLTATGRFPKLILQGGVSSGRRLTDNCDVVSKVPEAEFQAVAGFTNGVIYPFCHVAEPMLTQVKGSVSYLTPWWDIRVSGTLQSVTGPLVVARNTYVGTGTGLGRPFSSGTSTVNLISGFLDTTPFGTSSSTFYGDRLTQVDLRFTKILRFGPRGSVDLNVDLYNAFNSDAILSEQANYGVTWRNAQGVIQPRFVKFQVRWDF